MAGRTAIGLDIGTSGVRAAELSFGKDGITLEKFGQVAVPVGAVRDGEVVDGDAVTAAVRQLWQATRFGHKRVVLGVANQRVIVRQVDLPAMAPAELRKALPFQVQDFLPMPVDEAVLDFHPLEDVTDASGNRLRRGLLVAASRETVLANVRCAQKAGLTVSSVDLTSFALLRAVGTRLDPEVGTEALVDVGARVTNVVVHSGGVPRFVRILLMGGADITDALSERLGVDIEDAEGIKQQVGLAPADDADAAARSVEATAGAFIDEVRGSLDYYAASHPAAPVERLVVSGGGSQLSGLVDRLEGATRLRVRAGNPIGTMQVGRTGLDDDQLALIQPLAAVPVGLALGAMR